MKNVTLAIDEALTRLAAEDSEGARLIELRYYTGISIEEAAENDFNFHMALIGLADNRMLTDMYSFLSPVILRIMTIGKEMRPVLADRIHGDRYGIGYTEAAKGHDSRQDCSHHDVHGGANHQ